MGYEIAIGARVRKSPFFDKTVEAGVTGFTVYNHMYMPTGYGDPQSEYNRLIHGVAMWDVSVERQVELVGKDAEKLARILTPRNLNNTKVGQGRYVPLCDHRGVMINDPVLLPVDEDRYWLSIADSDISLWARAIAAERNLDVLVHEPDVSPLAIQGPKAVDVVAALFGEWIRELKFFGFKSITLEGMDLIVARSGWSKQGGFEIYLQNSLHGPKLWDLVKEAGKPFDIGPGNPNYIERIESGLVSYGADTDDQTTPYEMGLGKFVNLDQDIEFIGKNALLELSKHEPKRRFTGFHILGDMLAVAQQKWPVSFNGEKAGFISASCYSPRLGMNIGIGLLNTALLEKDETLDVATEYGALSAKAVQVPFAI